MAKHLKLTIKNAQIAQAVDLSSVKEKLAKKEANKQEPVKEKKTAARTAKSKVAKEVADTAQKTVKEEQPRIRARSKSVFAETAKETTEELISSESETQIIEPTEEKESSAPSRITSSEELRRKIFGEEPSTSEASPELESVSEPTIEPTSKTAEPLPRTEAREIKTSPVSSAQERTETSRLGPTGRHIKDILPTAKKPTPAPESTRLAKEPLTEETEDSKGKAKVKPRGRGDELSEEEPDQTKKGFKAPTKEFRDLKPAKRQDSMRTFDARDRQGLRDGEEDQRWRKRRPGKQPKMQVEETVVRPTSLKVRTPISIKDLAAEMKLKASQLISKLFLQGVIVTLNDLLDDETTIQLLGQEFGCEITIDTSEEQRIRITDKTVKEEIAASNQAELITRPPVIAFMGHVDHGKTSLIDAIRKSNRAAGEAGAITQHIGAFRCHTAVGDITVLDTPGHEAFSAMRARGADVTDIVVLVVAGDEGIRQQTIEAMNHAKSANVTIVVAINKSDKPGFNPDNVYRQLAEHELLPEAWGGQTLTVNCSAATGAGIKDLLETLALQAEVLELKANPNVRARGTVLESEMHKGLGTVATILVQNGTIRPGDSLVFEQLWGRVKTMRDEFGRDLTEAGPSTPVLITGLSGLPDAGQEFIVVKNEREAREISDARQQGFKQSMLQQKKVLTVENLLQEATPNTKKVLNLVIKADVQGSLEALKIALQKIESQKAEVNIIYAGVGEITESDIQRAATSKGVVLGFHTKVESHADALIKQLKVPVKQHDIIYHAIDDVKAIMTSLLDKIAIETDKGKAEVKALFKSSHAGTIAGCSVIDGTIQRNNHVRIIRDGAVIGTTQIASLRRVKEDAKEVSKGMECGIVLSKFTDIKEGDILQAYEITYITQEL